MSILAELPSLLKYVIHVMQCSTRSLYRSGTSATLVDVFAGPLCLMIIVRL